MSYLNIALAGEEFGKEKIREKNRREKTGSLVNVESIIGKGKKRQSPEDQWEEGDHHQRSPKRRLNASNLRALTQIMEESSTSQSRQYELRSSQAGKSSSASQQSKKSQPSSEYTSTHLYSLRSRNIGSLGSSQSIASQGSHTSTLKLMGGEGSSPVNKDYDRGKAAQVESSIKGP